MSFKVTSILLLVFGLFFVQVVNAWDVDMSRRTKSQSRNPASLQEEVVAPKKLKVDDFVSKGPRDTIVDRQEVVILNTGKGFIPSNLRLRKGLHYMIHVVNVNKDNKNVSFMLDAFSQHHSTFYGETKTFRLDPEKEGVFDFQCPETSAEGKLVVYGPNTAPVSPDRSAASE